MWCDVGQLLWSQTLREEGKGWSAERESSFHNHHSLSAESVISVSCRVLEEYSVNPAEPWHSIHKQTCLQATAKILIKNTNQSDVGKMVE